MGSALLFQRSSSLGEDLQMEEKVLVTQA